jgi:hypothetical protein
MGLFDTLICEMKLPEFPEGVEVTPFQTKNTPNQTMSTYKITADGDVLEQHKKYKYNESARNMDSWLDAIGAYEEVDSYWSPCHFTAGVEFYEYWNHPEYDPDDKIYFEAGFIRYSASIVEGKCNSIKVVEKRLPIEYTYEEVQAKCIAAEKQREEFRNSMKERRMNRPSTTEELVDDIDNLIKNKPAIFDRSDLISTLNKISGRIEEWREKHDFWYDENFKNSRKDN